MSHRIENNRVLPCRLGDFDRRADAIRRAGRPRPCGHLGGNLGDFLGGFGQERKGEVADGQAADGCHVAERGEPTAERRGALREGGVVAVVVEVVVVVVVVAAAAAGIGTAAS